MSIVSSIFTGYYISVALDQADVRLISNYCTHKGLKLHQKHVLAIFSFFLFTFIFFHFFLLLFYHSFLFTNSSKCFLFFSSSSSYIYSLIHSSSSLQIFLHIPYISTSFFPHSHLIFTLVLYFLFFHISFLSSLFLIVLILVPPLLKVVGFNHI